jgi:hypothetical protein
MTYPPHYLLSWGGDFVSEPLEIWSNGIRLTEDTNLDGATFPGSATGGSQDMVNHYAPMVRAHFAHIDSAYSSNVRLKWVKMNEIRADGRQRNQEATWASWSTLPGSVGATIGQGAITHAMCVTFLTDASRGRASRGRLFVPHPSLIVQSGHGFRYDAARVTAVLAQWTAFLTNLCDAPGVDGPDGLVPSVVSDLETAGPYRNITKVQIGNFPDYMGSRRNRTRETRQTGATIPQ